MLWNGREQLHPARILGHHLQHAVRLQHGCINLTVVPNGRVSCLHRADVSLISWLAMQACALPAWGPLWVPSLRYWPATFCCAQVVLSRVSLGRQADGPFVLARRTALALLPIAALPPSFSSYRTPAEWVPKVVVNIFLQKALFFLQKTVFFHACLAR